MRSPFFPVGPEVFGANIEYRDFNPRDRLEPFRGVRIETLSLNHHGFPAVFVRAVSQTAFLPPREKTHQGDCSPH